MSDGLPRIEARDLLKALRKAGFVDARQRGSHLVMVRDVDGKQATIPIHAGRVIPPGTLRGILRDIGMTAEDLRALL